MSARPGFFQAAAMAFASRFAQPQPVGHEASHDVGQNAGRARRTRAPAPSPRPAPSPARERTSDARDAREREPRASASEDRAAPKSDEKSAHNGREASTPAGIPAKGWKEILGRVWEQIGKDRVMAVAAGVTFYGLLALFPLITALVSIYGFVADPVTINDHLRTLSTVLPGGALDVVGEQVTRISQQPRAQLGFGFIAGLAITLWSANAGMKAIFDALNVAYNEEEKRSFLALNVRSMTFTILGIVAAVVAMLAVVALPPAIEFLGLGAGLRALISIGRWPVMLLALMVALAALYRYGPSREEPQWKWLSPGAIVAAIVWLIASLAFSYYAANFGSYNETYGSLGAVIGFMTWMWISVTIILVGAEINAEAENQTRKDTTTGPEKPMGERGAYVADTPPP